MSDQIAGEGNHERALARVRDFAIYIAIGVALAVGIILEADRGVTTTPVGIPWTMWAFGSALAFGLPISFYRRHWKSAVFWVWMLPLFLCHVFAWRTFLGRWFNDQESFSAWAVTDVVMAEVFVIAAVLHYASGPFWKKPKHARRRNAHRDT